MRTARRLAVLALLLSALGFPVPVSAYDPPKLVKDINPIAVDPLSETYVVMNGVLYYAGLDATHGYELWRSDGTQAGTYMVKDINPGSETSGIYSFVVSRVAGTDFLFFSADDGVHGSELWKSDGTEAGTVLVKDINPGSGGGGVYQLGAAPGGVIFQAYTPAYGTEPWYSTGTEASTVILDDINLGPDSSNPWQFTVQPSSGKIFFVAYDATHGEELWSFDLISAPVLVKDICPGADSSYIQGLTVSGSTLVMAANDCTHGWEPYQSSGVPGNGAIIKDIAPGADGSSPENFVTLNGDLFFTASDPTAGTELFKSRAPFNDASIVRDIAAGAEGSSISLLTVSGNKLFFRANQADDDTELWASDGITAELVKDIRPGSLSSRLFGLTDFNGTLIFTADDGEHGFELWKSDGTAAGTSMVDDLASGFFGSSPDTIYNLGTKVIFASHLNGPAFWTTDGTAAGTKRVADIGVPGETEGSGPANLFELGNLLFFSAYDGVHGTELWTTNGSAKGTAMVSDLNPGTEGSNPGVFFGVSGKLLFRAYDLAHSDEPAISDGTAAGTSRLTDLNSGRNGSNIGAPAYLNGVPLFPARVSTGVELLTTDGTAAGTVQVYNASINLSPNSLTVVGSKAFFAGRTDAAGTELWMTDGTAAGTQLVKDIRTGTAGSFPGKFVDLGGVAIFAANDGSHGTELWRSDGTDAGTTLIKDIYSGVSSSSPNELVVSGSYVYFTATDALHGTELWKTDGTAAGTELVKDIVAGAFSSSISRLKAFGSGIVMIASDGGAHGPEPWVSDGTAAGTHILKDINPTAGHGSLSNRPFFVAGDRLFFGAAADEVDVELWTSDGTEAGTVQVADINPGGKRSDPYNFALYRGQLYFSAETAATGRELWKLVLDNPQEIKDELDNELDYLKSVHFPKKKKQKAAFKASLIELRTLTNDTFSLLTAHQAELTLKPKKKLAKLLAASKRSLKAALAGKGPAKNFQTKLKAALAKLKEQRGAMLYGQSLCIQPSRRPRHQWPTTVLRTFVVQSGMAQTKPLTLRTVARYLTVGVMGVLGALYYNGALGALECSPVRGGQGWELRCGRRWHVTFNREERASRAVGAQLLDGIRVEDLAVSFQKHTELGWPTSAIVSVRFNRTIRARLFPRLYVRNASGAWGYRGGYGGSNSIMGYEADSTGRFNFELRACRISSHSADWNQLCLLSDEERSEPATVARNPNERRVRAEVRIAPGCDSPWKCPYYDGSIGDLLTQVFSSAPLESISDAPEWSAMIDAARPEALLARGYRDCSGTGDFRSGGSVRCFCLDRNRTGL